MKPILLSLLTLPLSSCTHGLYRSPGVNWEMHLDAAHASWWVAGAAGVLAALMMSRASYWRGRHREFDGEFHRLRADHAEELQRMISLHKAHCNSIDTDVGNHLDALEGQIEWLRAELSRTDRQFHPRGEEQAPPFTVTHDPEFTPAPDPGEGYKMLKIGEQRFDTDEFWWLNRWISLPANIEPRPVLAGSFYRREIEQPAAPAPRDRLPDSVWDGAPEWADYLARDECGECFWYEKRPYITGPGSFQWAWQDSSMFAETVNLPAWSGDWRESLHRRPGVTED